MDEQEEGEVGAHKSRRAGAVESEQGQVRSCVSRTGPIDALVLDLRPPELHEDKSDPSQAPRPVVICWDSPRTLTQPNPVHGTWATPRKCFREHA